MICIQAIRDKDVLILDEPNASLDEESIFELQKWLELIQNNHLIIIISHDDAYQNLQTNNIMIGDR